MSWASHGPCTYTGRCRAWLVPHVHAAGEVHILPGEGATPRMLGVVTRWVHQKARVPSTGNLVPFAVT